MKQLTARQLEILSYVANGYTLKEIASEIYLSHHTVRHITDGVRKAVGARHLAQLVAMTIFYGQLVNKNNRFVPASPDEDYK